ncbi:MAG: putative fluoride ion transporter CrcB [Bacteroidota bacterium]|jgi:CrcB protein
MELNLFAYLAVFVGGGAGSTLRYGMSRWLTAGAGWPGHWATLVINVLASVVLVLVMNAFEDKSKALYLLLLGTGFCGGWSTFSTFSVEALGLLQSGRTLEAIAYISLSLVLGIGTALLATMWMARQ